MKFRNTFHLIAISGSNLLIFSGRALANPAVPSLGETLLLLTILIMIINVPFNIFLYLLFMDIMALRPNKNNPKYFDRSPSKYLARSLGIVLFASIIGGLTDIMIFIMGFGLAPIIMVVIGLTIIFLSFFIPTALLQDVEAHEAAFVGTGITVLNILFWIAFGVFATSIIVYLAMIALIIMVGIPLLYRSYNRMHIHFKYVE